MFRVRVLLELLLLLGVRVRGDLGQVFRVWCLGLIPEHKFCWGEDYTVQDYDLAFRVLMEFGIWGSGFVCMTQSV